jgi:DNA-directed RNA polymerase specialized sigma24 family protein
VQRKIQDALDGMDSNDREIITLRHFEELSNAEAEEVLARASAELPADGSAPD